MTRSDGWGIKFSTAKITGRALAVGRRQPLLSLSLFLSLTRGKLSDLANRAIVASLRKKDVSLSLSLSLAHCDAGFVQIDQARSN